MPQGEKVGAPEYGAHSILVLSFSRSLAPEPAQQPGCGTKSGQGTLDEIQAYEYRQPEKRWMYPVGKDYRKQDHAAGYDAYAIIDCHNLQGS